MFKWGVETYREGLQWWCRDIQRGGQNQINNHRYKTFRMLTKKKTEKKEEANFNTLTPQYMAVAQKDANCSMLTPQNLT